VRGRRLGLRKLGRRGVGPPGDDTGTRGPGIPRLIAACLSCSATLPSGRNGIGKCLLSPVAKLCTSQHVSSARGLSTMYGLWFHAKVMANGGRKGLARRSGGLDEHRARGDSDNGVVREHDPLASRIHCYGSAGGLGRSRRAHRSASARCQDSCEDRSEEDHPDEGNTQRGPDYPVGNPAGAEVAPSGRVRV
jgi:hypothetical protein